MRTTRQIICVAMGALFFSALSCKNTSAQEKFSEAKAKEMLETFYTNYITELSKATIDGGAKADSLLNVYCSMNLLNELRDAWNYYPFIREQNANIKMLEQLAIRKDLTHDDIYYASLFNGEREVTVKIILIKHKSVYKMDYISLDREQVFSEEAVTKMLRTFYTNYITERSREYTNEDKVDSLLYRYCTINLINEKKDVWDHDPFLKSQMMDIKMLNKLSIRKDSAHNDIYYVSYVYGTGTTTIQLLVVKRRGRYKIDYMWFD